MTDQRREEIVWLARSGRLSCDSWPTAEKQLYDYVVKLSPRRRSFQ